MSVVEFFISSRNRANGIDVLLIQNQNKLKTESINAPTCPNVCQNPVVVVRELSSSKLAQSFGVV